MSNSNQLLALSICDFLTSKIEDKTVSSDNGEGIDIAIQMIREAFNVDESNESKLREESPKTSLSSIFDVYLRTQQKVLNSKPATTAKAATKAPAVKKDVSEEDKAKAEELKKLGNQHLAAKDYGKSIESYTQAIEINDTNAVYFSNRAAAYIQNQQYDLAIVDAEKATIIDPSYSKAWSRLGHSHYLLENLDEALDAYNKALEFEPSNSNFKSVVDDIKRKKQFNDSSLDKAGSSSGANVDAGAGAGGLPNLGNMDFGSLLNNPNIMQMAQQMMGNPDMMKMAKDPKFAKMAQDMMSNGGMADLMKNLGGGL